MHLKIPSLGVGFPLVSATMYHGTCGMRKKKRNLERGKGKQISGGK